MINLILQKEEREDEIDEITQIRQTGVQAQLKTPLDAVP